MPIEIYASAIVAFVGLGGLVFTALKWRRDDVTAAVLQSSENIKQMDTIMERQEREVERLQRALNDCLGRGGGSRDSRGT